MRLIRQMGIALGLILALMVAPLQVLATVHNDVSISYTAPQPVGATYYTVDFDFDTGYTSGNRGISRIVDLTFRFRDATNQNPTQWYTCTIWSDTVYASAAFGSYSAWNDMPGTALGCEESPYGKHHQFVEWYLSVRHTMFGPSGMISQSSDVGNTETQYVP